MHVQDVQESRTTARPVPQTVRQRNPAFCHQTLQPRTSDQETPDFAAKLQTLKDIIKRQEIDLLNWPNSPSKDRFYASHLKAKRLVAELAEDFSGAATAAANSGDQACGE
jgi:hypothetical protein